MSPLVSIAALCGVLGIGVVLARHSGLAKPIRGIAAVLCLVGVYALLPIVVVGYGYSKGLLALVAVVTALVLLAAKRRLGPWGKRRHLTTSLLLLGSLATVAHTNFGSFHGFATLVQFHDAAHYYLGAKYLPELKRDDLYPAMLLAEAESAKAPLPRVARDLRTYEVVPVEQMLERSESVKGAFSAARWGEFKKDVALFRRGLNDNFAAVFVDHGFNASPVWLLIGSTLTQWVPAGKYSGLRTIALVDVGLVALGIAGVGWAFGLDTALLILIGYFTVFGAGWGWNGGSVLRQIWFACTLLGVSCIKKQRMGAAGILLGVATLMRLFPGALLIPVFFRAAWLGWRRGKVPRRYLRFFGGFVLCCGLGVAAVGTLPRGYAHLTEFTQTMQVHSRNLSSSRVGLEELTGFHGSEVDLSWEQREAIAENRDDVRLWQRLLVLVPLLGLTAFSARRVSDIGALALGLPLIFVGNALASYYYTVLVVFLLAQRFRLSMLALCFVSQGLAQGAGLLERRDILPFVYQSALLLLLWAALHWTTLRRFRRHAGRGLTPAT